MDMVSVCLDPAAGEFVGEEGPVEDVYGNTFVGKSCGNVNPLPTGIIRRLSRAVAAGDRDAAEFPLRRRDGQIIPVRARYKLRSSGGVKTWLEPKGPPAQSSALSLRLPQVWKVRGPRGQVRALGVEGGHDRTWHLARGWARRELGPAETESRLGMRWVQGPGLGQLSGSELQLEVQPGF